MSVTLIARHRVQQRLTFNLRPSPASLGHGRHNAQPVWGDIVTHEQTGVGDHRDGNPFDRRPGMWLYHNVGWKLRR